MTDSSNAENESCEYCETERMVYRLNSDRGVKHRCIECLAIEQMQQQFRLPFDVWIDRDDIEPSDHPKDALDEPLNPTKHDYQTARAWATVLARVKNNDQILLEDSDAIGSIFDQTREFLINVMGRDVYKKPSELAGEQ